MRIRAFEVLAPLTFAVAMSVAGSGMAQGVAGPYLAAKQAEQRGDVAAAARLYGRTLARDPNNTAVMESAMLHQIAAGNVSEGVALARRYEDLAPGHHLGVLALAASGLRDGRYAEVRALLNSGGPFVGQVIEAWAAFGDDDLEGARERLKAMMESSDNGRPGQLVAAYHLGLIEAAAGNDDLALEAMTRAADMAERESVRMTSQRARTLARLGRTDEALDLISRRLLGTYGDAGLSQLATELRQGDVPDADVTSPAVGAADVFHGVAGLLARGQNRIIALAYARLATYLDPDLTEAQLLAAQILDRDNQYELAIEAYDAVPTDAPEGLRALIGKAEVMQASGRTDEAIAVMRDVIERFPDNIEARTSLGNMLRRESRFEEAGEAYDSAVALLPSIEPEHWVLFYQRGIAMERSDQWEKAEEDFRRALELEPEQPDVLNYLGYSWVEQGANLTEAEDMIRKAVDQRPEDGYIVDSLGWVLYRFGEFDAALVQLEKAVELRPVDPVINDHFGDALWMVGRRTEARFQWKRALSFEPEDKDAERIRLKLEIGLDEVLAKEEAEGLPGIIGRQTDSASSAVEGNDGG